MNLTITFLLITTFLLGKSAIAVRAETCCPNLQDPQIWAFIEDALKKGDVRENQNPGQGMSLVSADQNLLNAFQSCRGNMNISINEKSKARRLPQGECRYNIQFTRNGAKEEAGLILAL